MECSVGQLIGEECHKCVYGPVSRDIKLISELSEEDRNLLHLRTSSAVVNICKYHEIKFFVKYCHLFGNSCCDPLKIHKKIITKGLREIKVEHLLKEKNHSLDLIPGKSLCATCCNRLFVIKEKCSEGNDDFRNVGDFIHPSEHLDILDATCSNLGLSPVSKIRKLSSAQRPVAIQTKLGKLSQSLKRRLAASFEESAITDEPLAENLPSVSFSKEYEGLIEKLKQKCVTAEKEEKVKILSLLPESWSRKKVSTEFQVSERLVKVTRYLTKAQGILPDLGKRSGKNIDEDTVRKVTDFYTSEENSRILPGKKDYVSVRINGVKEHKQKQLLLCNLNELHLQFKEAHPECKIKRSKFCELRPKWCVIAGASGTHSVCVCSYHQNVKLMVDGAKLNVDYKDLLQMLVCSLHSSDCMMNKCTECPDSEKLLELLLEEEETDEIPENISYKQWVTTDRAEMVSVVKPRDEFIECLVQKLNSLKPHHYVSKVQSSFLTNKKKSLLDTECIILADFSENFSFIIQDEIQSFHWVNKQATVHPFVYYFKENNQGELKSRSLCVISDHLEHNTIAVHTFQKHLIDDIKTTAPSVTKVFYFTDGAASQYKNKKNFLNLCNHEKDFGLQAEWHFFASCHGKNTCDGIGGTTKREVTKRSLQMTTNNQILCPEDMFEFCDKNLSGIKYVYINSEEVVKHGVELKKRFENCLPVPKTRSYHRYVPINDTVVRCYHTSISDDFEEVEVSKASSLSLQKEDIVACVYEEQWYLGIIKEVSIENNDFKVHFYEPAGPRTSFKISRDDKTWVPLKNILRKLTPMELTTVTGRSHTITPQLGEEISQLFVEHHI